MGDINIRGHHAFIILGEKEILPKLYSLLDKKLNFKPTGNPDYWLEEVETFGIEESRRLKEFHLKKAIKAEKVFVVISKFITHEAQNAPLKTLEDPTLNSFFFFILPSKEYLSATLLSRFMILGEKSPKAVTDKVSFDADYFLSLSPAGRIKLLTSILNAKDKKRAEEVINSLEDKLKTLHPVAPETIDVFEMLLKSRHYLQSRGASAKLILENLALNMPEIR
jgi:hypothetical protein